jgi:preprotein translocase subunit SecA
VHLEGGGLEDQQTPDQSKLSYTAPDEDGAPSVSGAQGETGAGARARNAARGSQPAQPQQPAQRGAFGQQVPGDGTPANRAERRANKKK